MSGERDTHLTFLGEDQAPYLQPLLVILMLSLLNLEAACFSVNTSGETALKHKQKRLIINLTVCSISVYELPPPQGEREKDAEKSPRKKKKKKHNRMM